MVQTAIPEFMTCHLEFSRLGFSPKNEEWRQAPCGMWGVNDFVDICQRFLRFEVTPIWATDRDIDLSTSNGQMFAAMKAWVAQQEKEAIMRRFRRGRQDRIAAGKLDKAT